MDTTQLLPSFFHLRKKSKRCRGIYHVALLAGQKKNIPVATHAQCVEKSSRGARCTRRKEVFEINHGSRQQVQVLPHDSGSCTARLGGNSIRTPIHVSRSILFLNHQICLSPCHEKDTYIRPNEDFLHDCKDLYRSYASCEKLILRWIDRFVRIVENRRRGEI